MKAIIMAGGEGSRLRPLTCDCPKPMMRLMDRPVMQYALELLRAHGIQEVAATLGYLPDAIIDYFGDGSAFGVSLHYYVEETPLGTAGGVKQAQDFLDETFIVLSGDGITDLNIASALDFHRKKNALATLVLRREESPLEYGVVTTDSDGKIRAFYEKPARCDAVSDTVNTGIYILEPEVLNRIPNARVYDFGHDLFPALVQAGEAVYGYVTEDYWCDIGDVRAYLSAHRAAMDGGICLNGLSRSTGAVVLAGAQVDPTAILEAPCLIASGAQIASGAKIGAYTVVGENAFVGKNADLKRSILWSGARAEDGAQLRGAILACGASIASHAQAYEESVLGTGARAETRSVILSGIKLWPEKTAGAGERLDANRVWGGRIPDGFRADAVSISTPDRAARAAQACMAVLKPRDLLLGRDDSPVSSALWHAAAAGAMAQGITVIDAGVCALPQLRFTQSLLRAEAAALIQNARITLLNDHCAPLSAKQRRSIDALLARHDYAPPFSAPTQSLQSAMNPERAYIAEAAAHFRADPSAAPRILLRAESPSIQILAEKVLARIGVPFRTESVNPAPTALEILLEREAFGELKAEDFTSRAAAAENQMSKTGNEFTPSETADNSAEMLCENTDARGENTDVQSENADALHANINLRGRSADARDESAVPISGEFTPPETAGNSADTPRVNFDSHGVSAEAYGKSADVRDESAVPISGEFTSSKTANNSAEMLHENADAYSGNTDAHGENTDVQSENADALRANINSRGVNAEAYGRSADARDKNIASSFGEFTSSEVANNSSETLRAKLDLRGKGASSAFGELTLPETKATSVPFLRVRIDARGESASFSDASGAFSEAELQLLRAWIALERGERTLILPVAATRAIEALARRYGARTIFVSAERAVWLNRLAKESPLQFTLWTDGIQFTVLAISALTEFGVSKWRRAMPRVCRESRRVAVPNERAGSVLRAFAESERHAEFGGGVRFQRGNGWGWICPDETMPEFRVITESASAETANELCDFCVNTLNQLANQTNDSIPAT